MNDTVETKALRFRTSLSGFHKGDVTDYIAKTAKEHKQELQRLQEELERLESDNVELRKQILLQEAELTALREQAEKEAQTEEPVMDQLELAAYRRAEAAERIANQRARKFYEQMDEISAAAAAQFQTAGEAANAALAEMGQQMEAFQAARERLRQDMTKNLEKIAAVSAMLPDPVEGLDA